MRRRFVNQTLMTTVAMVRVSQAGMNIVSKFLDSSEGPQVRAAKPSMMTVRTSRRFEEDLPESAPPWDVSSALLAFSP